MDDYVAVEVVRGLTARDFDKSMPSEINPTVWQDVYRPVVEGRELYVKFRSTTRENFCSSGSTRMRDDQPTRLPGRDPKRRERKTSPSRCQDADHQD